MKLWCQVKSLTENCLLNLLETLEWKPNYLQKVSTQSTESFTFDLCPPSSLWYKKLAGKLNMHDAVCSLLTAIAVNQFKDCIKAAPLEEQFSSWNLKAEGNSFKDGKTKGAFRRNSYTCKVKHFQIYQQEVALKQ